MIIGFIVYSLPDVDDAVVSFLIEASALFEVVLSIFGFLTAFLSNVGVIDLGNGGFNGLLELTSLKIKNLKL